MRSFKAYFKKEILESVRTNKYLILFIGIVFWALLDPLMLKLLPLLMKNYLPPDIAVMFSTFTRDTAFQTFLNDLFQIGTLFIAFTLMGLLSNEVSLKKLVFPYSRGANPAGVVLAKYIHYTVTISLFILIAFLTNYFYINRLFTGGMLSIEIALKSSLLYILYYSVLLSILLYFSSLFKKGIIAGITVLVLGYTLSIFNQFKVVRAYLPNYLLLKAADIGYIFDNSLIPTVIISFCIIILLIFFSILRMKKIDVA